MPYACSPTLTVAVWLIALITEHQVAACVTWSGTLSHPKGIKQVCNLSRGSATEDRGKILLHNRGNCLGHIVFAWADSIILRGHPSLLAR